MIHPSQCRSLRKAPQRRVLVVDDDATPRRASELLLRVSRLWCRLHTITPPLPWQSSEVAGPMFILLDIGMFVMDGLQVARPNSKRALFKDILLIALTGWGRTEDRRRAQAAGFPAVA